MVIARARRKGPHQDNGLGRTGIIADKKLAQFVHDNWQIQTHIRKKYQRRLRVGALDFLQTWRVLQQLCGLAAPSVAGAEEGSAAGGWLSGRKA